MMKTTIQIEKFKVATLHAISGDWITLKLPENMTPRFLHMKLGDDYNVDLTITAFGVEGEAHEPPSIRELLNEVSKRMKP